MSALILEHRPSGKTVAALKAVIQQSLEGGHPVYSTPLSTYDVINTLRLMNFDCELEGNVVKGTMGGRGWSFVVIPPL